MRLLKEPLLHFILIGAALFVLYSGMNRKSDAGSDIVVGTETITELRTEFSNDWNREPTPEEVEILTDDFIREELACREGRLLGFDQNDVIIRQRIRQKLELMVEEGAVVKAPTDTELAEYLNQNTDLFRDENGHLPELNQIRNLVIFEWENQLRLEQLDQFYNDLKSKYGVTVEGR